MAAEAKDGFNSLTCLRNITAWRKPYNWMEIRLANHTVSIHNTLLCYQNDVLCIISSRTLIWKLILLF